LQQGVRWGWIASNPAALATPPRVRGRQIDPPEPEIVIKLIEGARDLDPDFGTVIYLAASTGARRGELCGLRWGTVDLSSRQSPSPVSCRGCTRAVVEKDTKTHSVRRIAIDQATADLLTDHDGGVADRANATGAQLSDSAFVFSRVPTEASR